MNDFTRFGTLTAVSALFLGVVGCTSSKPKENPYTGILSGRGNVPPAYIEMKPVLRNPGADAVPQLPPAPAVPETPAAVLPGPVLQDDPEIGDFTVMPDEGGLIGGEEAVDAPVAPEDGALVLPEVPGSDAPSEGVLPNIYVVRNGDTISMIAADHGVKTADLMAANPQLKSPDKITVGQKLTLPAGAKASASPASGKSPAAPGSGSKGASGKKPIPADGLYTAGPGDSLWRIARDFGVSMEDLRAWNNLATDKVQVGQVFVLKSGVTATSSAPKAPAASATPAAKEAPVPSTAPVEAAVPAVEGPVETSASAGQIIPHVVIAGDTLDSLATIYVTTREAILRVNPQIKGDADLKPDMVINIGYP